MWGPVRAEARSRGRSVLRPGSAPLSGAPPGGSRGAAEEDVAELGAGWMWSGLQEELEGTACFSLHKKGVADTAVRICGLSCELLSGSREGDGAKGCSMLRSSAYGREQQTPQSGRNTHLQRIQSRIQNRVQTRSHKGLSGFQTPSGQGL